MANKVEWQGLVPCGAIESRLTLENRYGRFEESRWETGRVETLPPFSGAYICKYIPTAALIALAPTGYELTCVVLMVGVECQGPEVRSCPSKSASGPRIEMHQAAP